MKPYYFDHQESESAIKIVLTSNLKNFRVVSGSKVAPQIASAPFVPGSENETFNVGADRPLSINELVRVVASAFGVEPQVEYLPPRIEVDKAWADHSKAIRVFRTHHETSIDDGIRRMAEWARQVGPRKSVEFSNIELPDNLPPSWASVVQS